MRTLTGRRGADPDGYSVPTCPRCWRPAGVLRGAEVWVEDTRTAGRVAHRVIACTAIRPGSRVERDVAVAYLTAPTPRRTA
ncbi:hypothetical protein [Gordonia humi]|uniref:Uncharacterized protein n=1 Tax=Gordonia humi TaxID=686429 RepID=A0A840F979_9ACTN|nr:hypothetical protein [Gordonia humi]MBB4136077.1 hypothetical protein [Gordonia humi]